MKALQLLAEIGSTGPDALPLTDLVSRTETEPSTAIRLLAGLVEKGFLDKVDGKRYRLGRRVYNLGLAAGPHVIVDPNMPMHVFDEPKPVLTRPASRPDV